MHTHTGYKKKNDFHAHATSTDNVDAVAHMITDGDGECFVVAFRTPLIRPILISIMVT